MSNNQLCGDLPNLSPASTLNFRNNHWNCPLPSWCTGGICDGQVNNCENIPFGVCGEDTVIDFVVSTPTSAQVVNSNLNAFVVSGTGENGATYIISIPNATPSQQSGTVSGGVWQQTFNIASLPDGSVAIGIQASDIAGNSLSVSRSFTLNLSVPTIICPANVNKVAIRSTCQYPGSTGTPMIGSSASVSVSKAPQPPYSMGTTTVTYTVTSNFDPALSASCDQLVTVTKPSGNYCN